MSTSRSFRPAGASRDLRAELGLPPETRLLVFAGRFSAEKNIPVLLEAFRVLGAPYHLLLIGGGDGGRSGNVTRLPYCRDNRELAGYIRAADAFVHAGTHETFGLVILEALACGRPVVAMRAGAVPELLDERAGILAEPHDDAATAAANLAAAIAALYERDLDALGAAARAATWWPTTAGRARCRGSWRATRRRWPPTSCRRGARPVTRRRRRRRSRGPLATGYRIRTSRTTSAGSPAPTSRPRCPAPMRIWST